jgi:hypothetical protein
MMGSAVATIVGKPGTAPVAMIPERLVATNLFTFISACLR